MASRSSRARDPEPVMRSKKEPTVKIHEIRREPHREHSHRREHSSHHKSRRKTQIDEEVVYVRRSSGIDRGSSGSASARSSKGVRRLSRTEQNHKTEVDTKGKSKERTSTRRKEPDGLPLRKERRSHSEDTPTSFRDRLAATKFDPRHPFCLDFTDGSTEVSIRASQLHHRHDVLHSHEAKPRIQADCGAYPTTLPL